MTDQPNRRPIIGFAAGTPIRTAGGSKPIEDVKPGDFIQTDPDEVSRTTGMMTTIRTAGGSGTDRAEEWH